MPKNTKEKEAESVPYSLKEIEEMTGRKTVSFRENARFVSLLLDNGVRFAFKK